MAIRKAGWRDGVRFLPGPGREGPRKFLGQWEGILQTDGYAAYDDIGGPKLVHVGCWAHARRKFVDAVKVNPQDAEAVAMVTRMDALFLIDRDARQRELSAEERLAQRRQYAEEWLREIHETSLRLSRKTLPKSALGQAVDLHIESVAQAVPVFRLRRSRVVQQPGGELHAARRLGPQELAACGQSRSPARKWRRFSPWSNPAVGWACR